MCPAQLYYIFSNFLACLFLGMTNSYAEGIHRPSFIQENELRHLVLKVSKELYLPKLYLPFHFYLNENSLLSVINIQDST